MAKLSDIAESNKEHSAQTHEQLTAHALGSDDKSNTFESEFVIFKLANSKKRGRVYIDGITDAKNPKTGKIERARLLSGVDTIWMSEQKELDKDYVRQNRRSLVFESRVCRIHRDDHTAIEFARATKYYIDDPTKKTGGLYGYFEWNPQRQAEAAMAKRKERIDAMTKAIEAPIEKARKHAFYLGVLANDELGLPKRDDAIRDEYIGKAEENPQLFLSTYGSLLVDVAYLVTKAIIDAKIDLGKEKSRAYWSTGAFICSIPPSRKAKEVLVELATTQSVEGKLFLEQLQQVAQ